jgi:hypothetical protein
VGHCKVPAASAQATPAQIVLVRGLVGASVVAILVVGGCECGLKFVQYWWGGNYRAALLYWQDWGKYSGMITARILTCVLNYDLWQLGVVSVLLRGKQSERIFLSLTHKDMHRFTHFMVTSHPFCISCSHCVACQLGGRVFGMYRFKSPYPFKYHI